MTTTLTPPRSTDNPLLEPNDLPFGVPAFDRIRDTDYQPAIEEGMRQHLAEVEAIARQSAPPTFENTLVALERSGVLLSRVLRPLLLIRFGNRPTPSAGASLDDGMSPCSWTAWLAELDRQHLALKISSSDPSGFELVDRKELN